MTGNRRTDVADTKVGPSLAFREFYHNEYRDVVGLAYVLTGNRWLAEDLTQDAFAAASAKWDRIGNYDEPGAWVRRAVANRSVSWFRRRAAEQRAYSRIGNPATMPSLNVEAEVDEVWTEVRSLPKRQAQAIALVFFDGMTVPEASQVLGCSIETARTHLKRGKKALARRLGVVEVADD